MKVKKHLNDFKCYDKGISYQNKVELFFSYMYIIKY